MERNNPDAATIIMLNGKNKMVVGKGARPVTNGARAHTTPARSLAIMVNIINPDGSTGIGYVIGGITYKDAAGNQRIDAGTIVQTGNGLYKYLGNGKSVLYIPANITTVQRSEQQLSAYLINGKTYLASDLSRPVTGDLVTTKDGIWKMTDDGAVRVENNEPIALSTSEINGNSNNPTIEQKGVWPVQSFDNMYISSPFGQRSSGNHKGIDISGEGIRGKNINAAFDGKVVLIKYDAEGYGQYVIIESSITGIGTVCTLYAHMIEGSPKVTEGEIVEAGQTIGSVGNTGRVSPPPPKGNHLHFEIRPGSYSDFWNLKPVDPLPYLQR